jgi:SAM-dependent methyltransferase
MYPAEVVRLLRERFRSKPLAVWLYRKFLRMRANLAFRSEFKTFERLSAHSPPRFRLLWSERRPFLSDRTAGTLFDRHYIYHPAWAARALARTRPAVHIDISSTLHFCSIVSAFVPVKFYDYRPADLRLSDLSAEFADLLALPFPDASVESLSCMHTVEHIGLGRYGDPIDPDGDLKAIAELRRVLSPGGSLLFVVPVGQPRIVFNAHRIYAYEQIMNYFAGLELHEFALVPDRGALVEHATKEQADAQRYGCGCFWFQKQ